MCQSKMVFSFMLFKINECVDAMNIYDVNSKIEKSVTQSLMFDVLRTEVAVTPGCYY